MAWLHAMSTLSLESGRIRKGAEGLRQKKFQARLTVLRAICGCAQEKIEKKWPRPLHSAAALGKMKT